MSYLETLPDRPGTWEAHDAWASERETGEFLFGLVRLLKPTIVLETGCHLGMTTVQLGYAVAKNKVGAVHTCDIDPIMQAEAASRTTGLPVQIHGCTGEELIGMTRNVDFAFIDSSGDRVAECLKLHLSPCGIVVLHDARRQMLQEIVEKTNWQSIFIDSPRGCAILQPRITL